MRSLPLPQPAGLIAAALLALLPVAARSAERALPLVPFPRELSLTGGKAVLSEKWGIRLEAGTASDSFAAALLSREAREGWGIALGVGRRAGRPVIVLSPLPARGQGLPPLFAEQGYELEIRPTRIEIRAPSAAGRFYGVQTLRQLMRASRGASLPCVSIRDYPALAWRGVSDDVSRSQVSTPDDFRAIIENLAYYKLNTYHLYIPDVLSFRHHPDIGKALGQLDPAELAELVAEARQQHVTVVPIFETLGHQERILGLPGYRRFAEARHPDDLPWTTASLLAKLRAALGRVIPVLAGGDERRVGGSFSPVLPETRRLVEDLADEVADAVPSPFFHLGGDEAFDLGTGTSRRLSQEIGAGRVYARYMNAVAQHVRERNGRRCLIYSDMLLQYPEALEEIGKDLAVVDWHYEPADTFPSLGRLGQAGFRDILVSPGLWNWNVFYPEYGRAFPNIRGLVAAGKAQGAKGSIVASWTEGGESLREYNWPGYALGAAAAWEAEARPDSSFLAAFVAVHYGARSARLARALHLLGWQDFGSHGRNGRLYHRPPLVRERTAEWRRRMSDLRADMLEALDLLRSTRAQARFNREEFPSLRLAARRFLYVADRELLLDEAAASLTTASARPDRRALRRRLAGLRTTAAALAEDFWRLWLTRYKPRALPGVAAGMGQQVHDLDALIARVDSGEPVLYQGAAATAALAAPAGSRAE
jgi:hypothetical protein